MSAPGSALDALDHFVALMLEPFAFDRASHHCDAGAPAPTMIGEGVELRRELRPTAAGRAPG